MKNIELNSTELESIVGGEDSQGQYNLGYVVGYVTAAVTSAYNWLTAPATGGMGSWTPYPGMTPGAMQ